MVQRRVVAAGAALLLAGLAPAAGALPAQARGGNDGHGVRVVTDQLDGPRGVDHVGRGLTVVGQADGTVSLVVQGWRGAEPAVREKAARWAGGRSGAARHDGAAVFDLTQVPANLLAPAVAVGDRRTLWILTVGGPELTPGAATLFKWRPWWDAPRPFADIGAYQATDPDPDDLEGEPTTSNPYGLAALEDGTVLVADAEGNDLLRVFRDGSIKTVARLLPRTVQTPEWFGEQPPEAEFPPPGIPLASEAVATSVAVGPHGYWYVGELRGFPGTAGTSQIWKIKPGSVGAVCDPEHPYRGACRRYADGLTSIVSLAGSRHALHALSLSKLGWLPYTLELPGAEVGGLYKITRHGRRVHELARDRLVTPGGVDSGRGGAYVTGPVFGPGSLLRVR